MGALLLIIGAVLFIALALWLAWGASQFSANVVGKLILAGIVLFFFYWVVFGRTNLAELEFKRLCEQEAGPTIYKTVQLPAQYFNQFGRPDFQISKRPGAIAELAGRYISFGHDEEISHDMKLNRIQIGFKDLESGEVLGTITTIRYFGASWVPVPGHVGGKDCPGKGLGGSMDHSFYNDFLLKIFRKQQ